MDTHVAQISCSSKIGQEYGSSSEVGWDTNFRIWSHFFLKFLVRRKQVGKPTSENGHTIFSNFWFVSRKVGKPTSQNTVSLFCEIFCSLKSSRLISNFCFSKSKLGNQLQNTVTLFSQISVSLQESWETNFIEYGHSFS